METNETIHQYFSELGKKGGSATSEAKKASSAANGRDGKNVHSEKLEHFHRCYRQKLEKNNAPFAVMVSGKTTEYIPDYFCRSLGIYIEVATSKPNISVQKNKWKAALKMLPTTLKIYWWEGEEITDKFN